MLSVYRVLQRVDVAVPAYRRRPSANGNTEWPGHVGAAGRRHDCHLGRCRAYVEQRVGQISRPQTARDHSVDRRFGHGEPFAATRSN